MVIVDCGLLARQSAIPIVNPQSQSSIRNLNRQSAIPKIRTHQSEIAIQCLPSEATCTRASLKQAPPPRSVKLSGTNAFDVDPL